MRSHSLHDQRSSSHRKFRRATHSMWFPKLQSILPIIFHDFLNPFIGFCRIFELIRTLKLQRSRPEKIISTSVKRNSRNYNLIRSFCQIESHRECPCKCQHRNIIRGIIRNDIHLVDYERNISERNWNIKNFSNSGFCGTS